MHEFDYNINRQRSDDRLTVRIIIIIIIKSCYATKDNSRCLSLLAKYCVNLQLAWYAYVEYYHSHGRRNTHANLCIVNITSG